MNVLQVAWCVARTSSSTGHSYPLTYDRVLVNEGNAFNPDTSKVVIPYTGYYLVHFGGGVAAGTRAWHALYSDGTLLTLLYRGSRVHNGIDTISKTVVRRFAGGTVVKVRSWYDTFSNSHMQTTFMGMLLYQG